jgi:hypothetical protein
LFYAISRRKQRAFGSFADAARTNCLRYMRCCGRKAVLKPPHSKRFARSADAWHSRSVRTAARLPPLLPTPGQATHEQTGGG